MSLIHHLIQRPNEPLHFVLVTLVGDAKGIAFRKRSKVSRQMLTAGHRRITDQNGDDEQIAPGGAIAISSRRTSCGLSIRRYGSHP